MRGNLSLGRVPVVGRQADNSMKNEGALLNNIFRLETCLTLFSQPSLTQGLVPWARRSIQKRNKELRFAIYNLPAPHFAVVPP